MDVLDQKMECAVVMFGKQLKNNSTKKYLFLGWTVNKTLICAEKEEIRMGGGIETLIQYRAEV